METAMLRTVLLVAAELLAQTALLQAADQPQWGDRDSRNMVSAEKGLPQWFDPGQRTPDGDIDLATTKNVRWVARLGDPSYGSPIVAGGKVFVGTNNEVPRDSRMQGDRGVMMCFDEQTGEYLWQLNCPKLEEVKYGDWHYVGMPSPPTVENGRAYAVTNRCEVVCLDVEGMVNGNQGPYRDEGQHMAGPGQKPLEPGAKDADILWRFDMVKELGVQPHNASNCSILLHGDLLYVCTSNGVDWTHSFVSNPAAPTAIVLNKNTGKLVAKDDFGIGKEIIHGQWSSPALGEVHGKKLVFFGGGDGVCYAFEALAESPADPLRLKTAWSFDCNPSEYKEFGGLDWATHYSLGDRRLKKSLNKQSDPNFVGMSEIIATPVFYKNRVYVAIGRDPEHGRGKGALWCIDATKSGDITQTGCVWSYKDLDRTLSTVSIADGLLYIADVAGRIHCLDAETGRRQWIYETKAETWASTLVADGKVYLGTQKQLFVLAAGKEAKLLAKINLGAPMWASPVAANGVLYIPTTRYLWAVSPK